MDKVNCEGKLCKIKIIPVKELSVSRMGRIYPKG